MMEPCGGGQQIHVVSEESRTSMLAEIDMLEEMMRHGLSMQSWVVIEAGMARLTASHCLHTGSASDFFGLCVVKAGHHIDDRIPASSSLTIASIWTLLRSTALTGVQSTLMPSTSAPSLAAPTSLGSEWTGSPSSRWRSPCRRRRRKGLPRRG
ncbi:hypothetical protein ZIOFF_009184 [Zingiber officinale]|uniref:Uncharacterized protein n=1 Tax=Zingiber officinale TaxID=94328 RepID=A0A8J5I2F3_ZINOF|nr:hypothetical protein ZIOFF_009184 [Zingiber officinale]